MQKQDSVTSLRAELIRAMEEIKALKDGTLSLKEQVEQQQEQLNEKDCLLKKETRKRRNRFRAYVDCLDELTACQAKCERLEAGLHQEPPQPETSWGRQMEVEEENQVLKEEVHLLKVGQRRLEDELMTKNQLIMSAKEKKRAQTSAYIDCLALLTAKEMELKKSQAAMDEKKAPQRETSWGRQMEVEEENQVLKEEVDLLKVGQRRLEDELMTKNQLIMSAKEKKRAQTSAYIDCLALLTAKEMELKKSQAAMHEKKAPQRETSCGRQVELEEDNQVLKEEVNLPKVGQRRQEVKLQQTRSKRLSCRMVEAETIWSREVEVDKENWFLKEQLNLPKVGQRHSR